MAYTPVGWQTGDTITADRLNRMDRGWGYENVELFSETVTTADINGSYKALLAYSGDITADTITVNFDGTEYTCAVAVSGKYNVYGDEALAEYPFFISSRVGREENVIQTQNAGTYAIVVSIPTLQTSADFDGARGWSYDAGGTTELFSETVTTAEQSGIYRANLAYSSIIDAASITVTFDGTEYTCTPIETGIYGAPVGEDGSTDFSTYPFLLMTRDGKNAILVTQTAGEHTIAVVANIAPSAKASEQFALAVGATGSVPLLVTIGTTTWSQVNSALKAGRPALVWNHTTQRNQPDTYEFVATARYTSWTVYTLAVDNGAVVVNTYQAASQTGALEPVTS